MSVKNLQVIIDYLGKEYVVKRIDLEDCVYRKLNNTYDIEISGAGTKTGPMFICVWDISNGEGLTARSVEYVRDIKTKEQLKLALEHIVQKYQSPE